MQQKAWFSHFIWPLFGGGRVFRESELVDTQYNYFDREWDTKNCRLVWNKERVTGEFQA